MQLKEEITKIFLECYIHWNNSPNSPMPFLHLYIVYTEFEVKLYEVLSLKTSLASCSSENMVAQSTFNACMTAYEESLARGKFQDGRSIWIDRSGVEVKAVSAPVITMKQGPNFN